MSEIYKYVKDTTTLGPLAFAHQRVCPLGFRTCPGGFIAGRVGVISSVIIPRRWLICSSCLTKDVVNDAIMVSFDKLK